MKTLKQTNLVESLRASAMVLAASAVGAILFGATWVVLGWMRFYGLEPGVVAQGLPIDPIDYHNLLLNLTATQIDWYNSFFQGNSRFGSGIGLMAGSCLSLLALKGSPQHSRMTAIFLAGAIVGGRLCLTFTSSPAPFLTSSLVAGTLFIAIALFSREALPALPRTHRASL